MNVDIVSVLLSGCDLISMLTADNASHSRVSCQMATLSPT